MDFPFSLGLEEDTHTPKEKCLKDGVSHFVPRSKGSITHVEGKIQSICNLTRGKIF